MTTKTEECGPMAEPRGDARRVLSDLLPGGASGVIRTRRCRDCGCSERTVEVFVNDVREVDRLRTRREEAMLRKKEEGRPGRTVRGCPTDEMEAAIREFRASGEEWDGTKDGLAGAFERLGRSRAASAVRFLNDAKLKLWVEEGRLPLDLHEEGG